MTDTPTSPYPTPWEIFGTYHCGDGYFRTNVDSSVDGEHCAYALGESEETSQANAHHIVKCVNMHDELLKACKRASEVLKEHSQYDGEEGSEEANAMQECIEAIAKGE